MEKVAADVRWRISGRWRIQCPSRHLGGDLVPFLAIGAFEELEAALLLGQTFVAALAAS
jgi:hypothetical protein